MLTYKLSRTLIAATLILAASACSDTMPRDHTRNGLVGGASGAVIGVGTGAIIGSTVSGVSDSAAMAIGGGSGLILGAIAGVAYSKYEESRILAENDEAIAINREILDARQREIDAARAQIEAETRSINPDRARREVQFDGATIGNPHR